MPPCWRLPSSWPSWGAGSSGRSWTTTPTTTCSDRKLRFGPRLNWKSTASYAALLAAAFVVAVVGSWIFGAQLDNYAYDYMFRLYQPPPWQPQSVLLAIDERTLSSIPGGIHAIRTSDLSRSVH